MAAEKFDAETVAKEAIATSPEVTEGVNFTADAEEISASKALNPEIEGIDYQPDKRNGRLLVLALEQWDRNKRLDPAQLEAAEEVGAEAFGAVNAAPVPHIAKLAVTIALLAASVIPLFLDISGALGEEQNHD